VLEVQLLVRAADRAVAEQILAQLASDQNGEGVAGDEGDGEAGSDDGGGDD
jgi:fructose-1,6-bisphosphatase/inositol monophosphatase family enzyme